MHAINTVSVSCGDADHSAIFRDPCYANLDLSKAFATSRHGPTIGHMLQRAVERYGPRPAVAYRPIKHLERTMKDGRPWTVYHFSPTVTHTYAELWDMMLGFGRGLLSLAAGSAAELSPGSRVAIYEETRMEWLVSCVGCWSQGLIPVTVFANLGNDAVRFALLESEVKVIVVNASNVENLEKMALSHSALRKLHLVVIDGVDGSLSALRTFASVTVWTNIVSRGRTAPYNDLPTQFDRESEGTAIIMYTSGTTGNPKGVELAHRSLVASVNGQCVRYQDSTPHDKEDFPTVFLAYLPLAHIFEFNSETIRLTSGSMVCYGRSATLLDDSARPHGDLREFRPHFLTAVPRVAETLRKAIQSRLPPEGSQERTLFEEAMTQRSQLLQKSTRSDPISVQAPMPAALQWVRDDVLGGRLCQMQAGGAPLNPKTQHFFQVLSGASVVQSWGLTEVCGAAAMQREWVMSTDHVGRPIPSVEIRLRRAEGWTLDGPLGPTGEICLRGPILAKGYFKREDLTKEVFLEDGWFCTGDVGRIDRAEGNGLRIVGRIKALAKNLLGEYIAMENLEAVYVQNDLCIPNGTCVVVNGQRPYIVGVFITDEARVRKFTSSRGIKAVSYPGILRTTEFLQEAQRSLKQTALSNGRQPFEVVRHVRFYDEEWTPQNNMLTAAMKLKRANVEQRYKNDIEEMFKEPSSKL